MNPDQVQVNLYELDGICSDGNQSFLVPLANHPDESYVEVKVRPSQVDHFANPQSATVKGFKQGLVSSSFLFALIDLGNQQFNLLKCQGIWQGFFQLWSREKFCRIVFGDFFLGTIPVKRLDA